MHHIVPSGIVGRTMKERDDDRWRAVLTEQCTGRGVNGLVAAAAPLAAALGAECLRAGGNAFDAVTVAGLAETVLLPPKCGLAGDLVALVVASGTSAPRALVAVGGAPHGLGEVAASGRLPVDGPLSVGVPAAPAGYAALSALGRFDRERHAAPAISLASSGFAWSSICSVLTHEAADLLRAQNPAGTRYLPDGHPFSPGAPVTLPGLATVLGEWVERGAGMLEGPVGRAIVAAVQQRGGVLDLLDLQFARARWESCVHQPLPGHDLWVTPGPTHGPSLADAVHELLCSEGSGERGPAQPASEGPWAPIAPAASYEAVARALWRRQLAEGEPTVDGGTSMVSCVDAEGSLVALLHSNSFPRYGSGIVVPDLDLILSNRAGRGFSARPGSANFPAPGKQPATTLHAWSLRRHGSARQAVGGTPGGVNQMPWNTQLLADLLSSPTWPGGAVVAPRWGWQAEDGGVQVEAGFEAEQLAALSQVAPRVVGVGPLGLRCAQQVVLRPEGDEAFVGAVDPRTVGAVVVA